MVSEPIIHICEQTMTLDSTSKCVYKHNDLMLHWSPQSLLIKTPSILMQLNMWEGLNVKCLHIVQHTQFWHNCSVTYASSLLTLGGVNTLTQNQVTVDWCSQHSKENYIQQPNGTSPQLVNGRRNTPSSTMCHNKEQHNKIWYTILHILSYAENLLLNS
jgi:hypothetical protein